MSDKASSSRELIEDERPAKAAKVDKALVDAEEMDEFDIEEFLSSQTDSGQAHKSVGKFNDVKTFNGQMYTGMSIGGSHTWNYDQGQWKETKLEPDLWKINFETVKRRNHSAPTGSGAPVGTEYHWLIVAHQFVEKIDANSYTTKLVGSKYKLAHKNVKSGWNLPKVKAQRAREIELLEDAKRRVEGLPAVPADQKVTPNKMADKGQKTLESMFKNSPTKTSPSSSKGPKRKREE